MSDSNSIDTKDQSRHPSPVSLRSADGALLLEFYWENDRFAHRVLRDDVVVATSIQGSADEAWPASPPLQQLSLEEVNDAPVILGVGAAGKGHWSVSVERTSPSQPNQGFKFHFACRSKDAADWLGSTYETLESARLVPLKNSLQKPPSDAVADFKTILPDGRIEPGTVEWSYLITAG